MREMKESEIVVWKCAWEKSTQMTNVVYNKAAVKLYN
jgi:hypothetical protein